MNDIHQWIDTALLAGIFFRMGTHSEKIKTLEGRTMALWRRVFANSQPERKNDNACISSDT
jgi:hypothetical protein